MSAGTLRRLHRRGDEHRRIWLDWWSGYGVDPDGVGFVIPARASVDEVCEAALERDARVVSWCGERPYGADLEGFAAWREPSWWQVRAEGHYLRDLLTPVLRYGGPDPMGGPPFAVDLRSAGEWFGDHADTTAREAYDAMGVVREVLAPRFWGSRVWASPQATGTDLLLRALPEGREWSPVPPEVARHLHSTNTQGRVETFPHPGDLPHLVEYDGRFFYAALCAEVPEGDPVTGPGWPEPSELGYLPGTTPSMVRGWFDCEFRAPTDWGGRPGMIPWLSGGGWSWPADRRRRRAWVSGPEADLALRWGWELHCRRHLCWPRNPDKGPLASWADLLVGARDQADLLTKGAPHRAAAAAALRAILLTTIGVLHGRGRAITRTAPYDPQNPPAGRWWVEGGRYVWHDYAPPARAEFAHPEWSATIWAKCRARLLDGPSGVAGRRTGALRLTDPSTLVAFSVDALYLSADPEWPDDGAAGRLRRKAVHPGPLPAPADRAQLLALLRQEREAANV